MKKYYLVAGFLCIVLFFEQCSKGDSTYTPKSKAELGEKIFFDTHLSNPIGQSCSSCHSNSSEAFSDPNHLSTSPGAVNGLFGKRNSMTLTYALYTPPLHYDAEDETFVGGLFWDGRVNSLEEQAKQPFFNNIEMNLVDHAMLAAKIHSAEYYRDFVRIYGGSTDPESVLNNVADALATFERTDQFHLFSSKYDYYLKGMANLSGDEKKGLELFTGKAMCSNCHVTEPDEASGKILFTDFTYDNIGVPVNPTNKFYNLPPQFNPLGKEFIDSGLGIIVNNLPDNGGQFKVPTLRNIELSAPYFHNGVFNTLDEVVHFYNKRNKDGVVPEVFGNVNHEELGELHLTDKEEKQVVAFMKTLTDGYKPHK